MEDKKEQFEYTYSAKQQEEIEQIRRKYLPKEEDKFAEIKRLDEAVTRPGMIISLALGIIGTLIFGAGMSLALVWKKISIGIAVSVAGFVILAAAYPVYVKITARQKEKIGPQILKLMEKIY